MSHATPWRTAVVGVLAAIASLGAAAAPASARATATDRAFVREMIPHHRMAVHMARMGVEQGQHRKLRKLAGRIIVAQRDEIRELRAIAGRLSVRPAMMPEDGNMSHRMMRDLEILGVPEEKSGMTMDMGMLDGAKPFDRMFISMMIPHHRGAVRMARAELAGGNRVRLRRMARAIVRDQNREVRQMKHWRMRWYAGSHMEH